MTVHNFPRWPRVERARSRRVRGSVGRWLADNRRAVPIVLSFVATTRLREMLSRSSCRCPQLLLLRTEFAYASPSILSIQRWMISISTQDTLSNALSAVQFHYVVFGCSKSLLWIGRRLVCNRRAIRSFLFHILFHFDSQKRNSEGIESTSIMCKRHM